MLSDQFLARLDALQLRVRHPSAGGAGGFRRSKALGSSVEFSDFREYVPGDDVRRLDWNAYARFDKLFLKQFMEEQETYVNIVIDESASMRFGEPCKWDMAVQLAQILCYLALTGNDRVVLYAIRGAAATCTAPLTGRQGYVKAASFLEALTPQGKTDLCAAVATLHIPQGRGITVLISDFLSPNGYEGAVKSLRYRKQEVTAIQLLCQQELEPSLEDAVQLVDSETGDMLEVLASYDVLRRYQKTVNSFIDGLKRFCSQNSAGYVLLHSEDDLEKNILRELAQTGLLA